MSLGFLCDQSQQRVGVLIGDENIGDAYIHDAYTGDVFIGDRVIADVCIGYAYIYQENKRHRGLHCNAIGKNSLHIGMKTLYSKIHRRGFDAKIMPYSSARSLGMVACN
jgi:hypothetical protein